MSFIIGLGKSGLVKTAAAGPLDRIVPYEYPTWTPALYRCLFKGKLQNPVPHGPADCKTRYYSTDCKTRYPGRDCKTRYNQVCKIRYRQVCKTRYHCT